MLPFPKGKGAISKWNFYSSLGFNYNDPGGIGECIYDFCKERVDYYNEEAKRFHKEYDVVFDEVKFLEGRVRRSRDEREAKWINSDYQVKVRESRDFAEKRDQAHRKAKQFSEMQGLLTEIYEGLFKQYFQEVYDAEMHDIVDNFYDDSPAGFRLLYKFGRAHSSAWKIIYHAKDYIDALEHFFNATERRLIDAAEFEGIENDFTHLVHQIVHHVRTDRFLETALGANGKDSWSRSD